MKALKIYLTLLFIIISGLLFDIDAQRIFYRKGFPCQMMIEKLNLNEKQKIKIEELQYNFKKKMINLQADIKMKRLELNKSFSEKEINRNKIINFINEINEIRSEKALLTANYLMDIYELLDEKQKEIFKEYRPYFFKFKYKMK